MTSLYERRLNLRVISSMRPHRRASTQASIHGRRGTPAGNGPFVLILGVLMFGADAAEQQQQQQAPFVCGGEGGKFLAVVRDPAWQTTVDVFFASHGHSIPPRTHVHFAKGHTGGGACEILSVQHGSLPAGNYFNLKSNCIEELFSLESAGVDPWSPRSGAGADRPVKMSQLRGGVRIWTGSVSGVASLFLK